MELKIERVRERYFKAKASLEEGQIVAELTGTADIPARSALQKFLGELGDEAARHAVSKVVIDLYEVEFMNSSCFKDFVTWINRAQGEDGTPNYQIHFLSSAEMHWQKRSLHALQSFAPDVVSIEVVER